MGTEIATVGRGTALAKISAANLPVPIANGIFDLLTAFAAGPQQEDADKKRLVRIYGEAVAGLEVAVATHAIGWLKLNNPRNPFRPTPQDVYETCQKIIEEWRTRVLHHFTVWDAGKWGATERATYRPQFPWGPAPFAPNCHIPDVMVKDFLATYLSYGHDQNLVGLGRERLYRIPADCFGDGQRSKALKVIADQEAQWEADTRHSAYLNSLDPDLRRHRRVALNIGDNHLLSEEELLAAAEVSLRREREENARRSQDAADDQRRAEVNGFANVRSLIQRMHAYAPGNGEDYEKAVADYVAELAKYGAKPPPHLATIVANRAAVTPT